MTEPAPRAQALLSEEFWSGNQPGFRFSKALVGTPEFFEDVERHRYDLEPHIPEVAQFEQWRGRDVLEVGCGIATDGAQFARAGARYTGVDQSETALELARRRFDLERIPGSFVRAQVTSLPLREESFDLLYSHGVIHHVKETEAAVGEFARVLRPGGEALVMLYHRNSWNYRVTISVMRRLLAATLLVPGAPRVAGALTGEDARLLAAHRSLLKQHGVRYLIDGQLFLSNNTDGPGNPLSKVFSQRQARALFAPWFEGIETETRFLNLRIYPGGDRLARTVLGRALERRIGWHLYLRARKPSVRRAATEAR